MKIPKSTCVTKAAAAMALALTLGAAAANATPDRPASLPFADLGNIRSWQPDGRDAILVESNRRKWYRATFFAPCMNLPFAFAVAFVSEPNGSLNKYSSILVEGERCWFRTFAEVPEPDDHDGRHMTTAED